MKIPLIGHTNQDCNFSLMIIHGNVGAYPVHSDVVQYELVQGVCPHLLPVKVLRIHEVDFTLPKNVKMNCRIRYSNLSYSMSHSLKIIRSDRCSMSYNELNKTAYLFKWTVEEKGCLAYVDVHDRSR